MNNILEDIYIINQNTRTERWASISSKIDNQINQLKSNNKTPKTYNQFIGIDGDNLKIQDYNTDVNPKSRNFFMTKHIYAKFKSHYNLWSHILDKHNDNKEDEKENNSNKFFLILEDDVEIPDNFFEYLNLLEEFLNKVDKDELDKLDLINLAPFGNFTESKTSINEFILKTMLSMLCLGFSKKQQKNKILYSTKLNNQDWNLTRCTFPLGTHSYLVNIKQLKQLKSHFDKVKIYYHLDIQLNLDNFRIGSISPFMIKRGGFKDSKTPTLTTPSLPVKMLTMFNPELAHDLGKPIINFLGIYQINILIIVYGIFLIIWQMIDLPGRLQEFFENI